MLSNVCVVLPLYRCFLDRYEKLSIQQCNRVLSKYDICVVAPEAVDIEWIRKVVPTGFVYRMHSLYFRSAYHYSYMFLNEQFLKHFKNYDYILVYQTDAYVFRDEVKRWVNAGYSYVGAPWKLGACGARQVSLVGNGGFSLRSVEASIEAVKAARSIARNYSDEIPFDVPGGVGTALIKLSLLVARSTGYGVKDLRFLRSWSGQEDAFFGVVAPSLVEGYTVCPPSLAALFSIDRCPRWFYGNNGRKLPFGCHGWRRNDPEFWASYIPGA